MLFVRLTSPLLYVCVCVCVWVFLCALFTVVNESAPGDDDDDLEGELSNLEHRVCNIPCSELSGMVKIGAGED